MSISTEEASAADETGRSLGSRLLSGMEMATPELATTSMRENFDDEYVREVRAAVLGYAAHGNVVIIGRGASAILGRRRDVLRVFMHAPRDWRIERIMEDLRIDRRTATAEIDRVDKARTAHLRDWYGAEFGNPEIYDLSIDTSAFGAQESSELIVTAARCRS